MKGALHLLSKPPPHQISNSYCMFVKPSCTRPSRRKVKCKNHFCLFGCAILRQTSTIGEAINIRPIGHRFIGREHARAQRRSMRIPSRHQDHRSIDRSEEKGATTSVFEHEHSISFGNQIGIRIPSRTFYPSLKRIRTVETIQKDGNKVVSKVGHHPRHKEAKDKLEDLEGSANVMRTWTLNWMKRVWTKALDEDDRGRSLPVQSRGSCFEW
ncbi:MAG: hypothetical protein J3Q66DRAFT_128341 [Benniella sp.]|nr:MAG: hypothetical protein J3Q66DRAFT_128341 [Benniella sp.]